MARLIDKDIDIYDYIETWDCTCSDYGRQRVMSVDDLEYLPTVEAAPVVHGAKITRVNDVFSEKIITVCSECSGRVGKRDVYCRHCGAKMDMDD